MLQSVDVDIKSLEDYRSVAGDEQIEEILDLAQDLQDARVVYMNATAFGGGVVEVLTLPLSAPCAMSAWMFTGTS